MTLVSLTGSRQNYVESTGSWHLTNVKQCWDCSVFGCHTIDNSRTRSYVVNEAVWRSPSVISSTLMQYTFLRTYDNAGQMIFLISESNQRLSDTDQAAWLVFHRKRQPETSRSERAHSTTGGKTEGDVMKYILNTTRCRLYIPTWLVVHTERSWSMMTDCTSTTWLVVRTERSRSRMIILLFWHLLENPGQLLILNYRFNFVNMVLYSEMLPSDENAVFAWDNIDLWSIEVWIKIWSPVFLNYNVMMSAFHHFCTIYISRFIFAVAYFKLLDKYCWFCNFSQILHQWKEIVWRQSAAMAYSSSIILHCKYLLLT